jgi:hypothetical protein
MKVANLFSFASSFSSSDSWLKEPKLSAFDDHRRGSEGSRIHADREDQILLLKREKN